MFVSFPATTEPGITELALVLTEQLPSSQSAGFVTEDPDCLATSTKSTLSVVALTGCGCVASAGPAASSAPEAVTAAMDRISGSRRSRRKRFVISTSQNFDA